MLNRVLQYITHDLTHAEMNAVVRVGWRSLLAIHIVWACGYLSVLGIPGFARASDTSGVKAEVAALSAEFQTYRAQEKVATLERELKDIDKEIFSIEARLAEIGRLGQNADQLYSQRLATLRTEKAAVERELATAMKHPALYEPGA